MTIPNSVLEKTIKELIKPVIGFLLDNGVTIQKLNRLIKETYIEVAQNEADKMSKMTNSRLSLMTGIHRKDISAMQSGNWEKSDEQKQHSLGARLLSTWLANDNYSDANNKPKTIPLKSTSSSEPSFENLVLSITKDIRPKTVLDEWLQMGIVKINNSDEVVLLKTSYIPKSNSLEQFYFFEKNLSDHIQAARQNLKITPPPFLEQSVYFSELSERSITELEKFSRAESRIILEKINRKAHHLKNKDSKLTTGKTEHRMRFNIYFYHEKQISRA